MTVLTSAVAILATGLSTPSMAYSEQVETIALATASFQTCEQLGFSVDRKGISDWIESAQEGAIAAGMDETEVQSRLKSRIDFEWHRALDRHARAKLMQHSPENVWRNNRYWQSRCEKLADDPASSRYFSQPET